MIPDSELTGIAVGALTLTPSFDADITEYTVTTSNATNKVTATAAEGAVITMTLNEEEFTNASTATWETGENVVEITVTETGKNPTVYTVTVTKESATPDPEGGEP